jgi:16S rRNA C967 or C1407 C5-methylase (RsmB/RsmF family)
MMADMLGGRGSVTGVDVAPPRLATCRTLVIKYGVPNVRLFLCDGRSFAAPPPAAESHETSGVRGPTPA